jgi:hypothetical protein
LSQPSINTKDLTSKTVLLAIKTAYFADSSDLLLLTQKTQSPRWVSWVARTGETSGAPARFAVLNAALASSASFFPSGGGGTLRGGDSFAFNAAQPPAATQQSTINIGGADISDLFGSLARVSPWIVFVLGVGNPSERGFVSIIDSFFLLLVRFLLFGILRRTAPLAAPASHILGASRSYQIDDSEHGQKNSQFACLRFLSL